MRHTTSFLGLGALVFTASLAACGGSEEARAHAEGGVPSGETLVVEAKQLSAVVPVDGTVSALREAVLSTRLMARITSIEVEVGDRVAEGEVVVRLGTDDVAANRQRADAALMVARAARDEAARHSTRMDTLYAQDAVALVQRDQARLALVQAESQVALAEASLQEVEAAARYSALRAPFTGTVVSRAARVGDLAAPGMPLIGLASDGPREVVLGVPPEVARGLEVGDEVTVEGEGVGRAAARVRAIAGGADPRSRTVEVRAELPATWPTGVAVTALVPAGAREGIAIPAHAVVRRGQLTGVRVVTDAGETLRWVRLGRTFEMAAPDGTRQANVEVLSGLVAGERIVL